MFWVKKCCSENLQNKACVYNHTPHQKYIIIIIINSLKLDNFFYNSVD